MGESMRYVAGFTFMLEGFFLYLLCVPFLIRFEQMLFFGYHFLLVSMLLVFWVMNRYIRSHLLMVPLLSTGILIGSVVLGWPIWFTIIVAGILYWRLTVQETEAEPVYGYVYLMLYLSLLITILLFFYRTELVAAGLTTIIIFFAGYWIYHTQGQEPKGMLETPVVLFLLAAISTGGLAWLLYPVVQAIAGAMFSSVFRYAGNGLEWALTRFGVGDQFIESSSTTAEEQGSNMVQIPDLPPLFRTEKVEETVSVGSTWVWIAVGGVLLILLVIWLYKRQRLGGISIDDGAMQAEQQMIFTPLADKSEENQSVRIMPPVQLVRKHVFQLERYANRHKKGRRSSETWQEWLTRIGIPDTSLSIYEKVRYGEADISKKELQAFEQDIREAKKQIKDQ
jgi:hypothetical protein